MKEISFLVLAFRIVIFDLLCVSDQNIKKIQLPLLYVNMIFVKLVNFYIYKFFCYILDINYLLMYNNSI